MKVMAVRAQGELFTEEERDMPQPNAGEVLIKVHACGICHSDHLVPDGLWQNQQYPRVPGHEVAGVVEGIGDGEARLKVGDKVGVGWHGGHDGTCNTCLAGHLQRCENAQVTGITTDGGYAEYMIAPSVACANIPDTLALEEAAPLMCAGVTSFNALKNSGASPGDLVGIQGLGGLGHVAIQYAKAMGYEVVAISRGADKASFAEELGADHYIDTQVSPVSEQLFAHGGAKAILATAPNAASISALADGLSVQGCLMVLGVPGEPIEINVQGLVSFTRRIQGWSSGTAVDSTAAMAFAQAHGIKPMIEVFPLSQANKAFEKMMAGNIRFRAVLTMD